jgi:hypothetical protein
MSSQSPHISLNSHIVVAPVAKQGDFVKIPFRLLSATTVGKNSWKATDFSNEEVLKASIPLLEGRPAFIDHYNWSVTEAIGVVTNVRWEEAYTDKNGNKIPAGIVGDYVLDAKSYPEIVRKVIGVLDAEPPIPPMVNGSSVTVRYSFVKSHTFEYASDPEWEFQRNLGKMVDGTMVRRIVTEIAEYRESSLVNFPADEFARNRMASSNSSGTASLSFNDEPENVRKAFEETGSFDLFIEPLELREDLPTKEVESTPTTVQTLAITETAEFKALEQRFETLEAERKVLEVQLSYLKQNELALQTSIKSLKTEFDNATTQLSQVQASLTVAEAKAIIADSFIAEKREAVLKSYRLSVEAEDEGMVALIQGADNEILETYAKTFGEQVENKFKATCKKCGSQEFTRQSSQSTKLNPDKNLKAKNSFSQRYFSKS